MTARNDPEYIRLWKAERELWTLKSNRDLAPYVWDIYFRRWSAAADELRKYKNTAIAAGTFYGETA